MSDNVYGFTTHSGKSQQKKVPVSKIMKTPSQKSGGRTTPDDIKALRDGDVVAFENIHLAWSKPIFTTLLRLTGLQEEAEDITQDIFARLWENREKLDPAIRINFYLFRMAKGAAIDYYRRRRVAGEYIDSMDWDELDNRESDSIVIEKEIKLLKKMALDLMPEYRRNIYKLSHEEGLSNDQIAERLNVKKETVYQQLSLARKHLRELMQAIMILLLLQ